MPIMGPKMPWWPHAPLRPKAPPAWVAARIRAEEARLAQKRDIAAALQEACSGRRSGLGKRWRLAAFSSMWSSQTGPSRYEVVWLLPMGALLIIFLISSSGSSGLSMCRGVRRLSEDVECPSYSSFTCLAYALLAPHHGGSHAHPCLESSTQRHLNRCPWAVFPVLVEL